MKFPFRWSLGLVVSLLLAACGGEDDGLENPGKQTTAAILAFEVSPSKVAAGSQVEVSWRTERASSLALTRNDSEVPLGSAPIAQGSLSITVDERSSFELVAVGSDGVPVRKSATVEISAVEDVPVVVLFEAVDPSPALEGEERELRWEIENADVVTVSNLAGFTRSFEGGDALLGSVSAPVPADGTFRLVAKRGEASATADVTLEILELPSIDVFIASHEILTAGEDGRADVSLSWAGVARATSLVLESDTLDPIAIHESLLEDGMTVASIERDTTFTLVATNADGRAEKSASVKVVSAPVIGSFDVSLLYVSQGEAVEVSWTTTGATSVSLKQNGIPVPGELPTSGSTTLTIDLNTTLEFTAFNEVGDTDVRSAFVLVGPPLIDKFETPAASVWLGSSIPFSWETLGGSGLTIVAGNGPEVVCSISVRSEVEKGSCLSGPIAAEGVYEYTLSLSNARGAVVTRKLSVGVWRGPRVSTFSVTPDKLTAGESVTVHWTALPDPDGVAPTLGLTATRGGPYVLPAGATGTATFPLNQAGAYEFTLTASTSSLGSVPALPTASVTVYEVPETTLTATPSSFDIDVHQKVTLSWTSKGSEQSLILYRLEGGSPTQVAAIEPANRATGSLVIDPPTSATTWRIVATNGAGRTAQAETTVTLLGPEILSLTGTPPTYPGSPAPPTLAVVAGDLVQLQWTTKRAESVSLNFLDRIEVIEDARDFVDITDLGGTRLPLQANGSTRPPGDEGSAVLPFPAGFTFPFAGVQRTSIVAHANGFASFDLTGALGTIEPSTTNPVIQLGAFVDDLRSESPNGSVYWLQDTDTTSGKKFLILQWKGIEGWWTAVNAGDLNFQIVLWENGEFEYRYGRMFSATHQGRADGNAAAIGVSSPSTSPWSEWLIGRGVGSGPGYPGGLSERGFTFRPSPTLALQGGHAWSPRSGTGVITRTATLTAKGATGTANASVSVEVHPRAFVRASGPTKVPRLEDATLSWSTRDATAVRVVDDLGTVRCTAGPTQIVVGSCTISESAIGARTYEVIATGALGREVSTEVDVQVISSDFKISRFDLTAPGSQDPVTEIPVGSALVLRWATIGGDSLELTANGTPISLPPGISLTEDSVELPAVNENTTFVLRLISVVDGTITQTRSVTARTFSWKTSLSAQQTAPGTAVDLLVNVTPYGPEQPVVYGNPPMQEVNGAGLAFADLDISARPGRIDLTAGGDDNGVKDLPFDGFRFPYMGKEYTSVRVATNGFLSFDTPAASNHGNTTIPTTNANNRKIHLAPFWDDLHTRTSGRIYAAKVDADTYVVQWSKLSAAGADTVNEYDLNFMVVLRSNGSFEFRYGTMAPRPGTSTLCFPNTCVNEAKGSSATIGYQNIDGTRGHRLHFGGTNGNVNNPAFPGGLTNRSFRFDPVKPGAPYSFKPVGVTSFEICASLGDVTECETVSVDARFMLSSFKTSAPSILWGGSADLSWTSRYADTLAIKANGVVIATETTVAKDVGTLRVSPTVSTTYDLELTNHHLGQTLVATVFVNVEQFDFDISIDKPSVNPGEEVTISWDVKRLAGGSMALTTPLEDVSAGSTFLDLTGRPGVVELIGANAHNLISDHPFQDGFIFPFLGKNYTSIRVASDGYLSFAGTDVLSTGANEAIPSASPNAKFVHLAPFWDDLSNRTSGKILAGKVGNQYVIQWSHVSMVSGSDFFDHDLNFQVVLSADGSFEFRYGVMRGLNSGTSTACFPNTCAREANGASATIGYQDPTGRAGDLFHFGGAQNNANNSPVSGGLANRAFRFSPAGAKGSVKVKPVDTRSYKVCAIADDFLECSGPAIVQAEWGPLSFTSEAPSVEPGMPVNLRWTTRGADAVTISAVPVAGGTPVAVPVLPGNVASGTAVDTLFVPTKYTLEVHSLGRTKTSTITVLLRTLKVELDVSPTVVTPSESVTIDWDLGWEAWRGNPLVAMPLFEVPPGPGTRFEDMDISAHPNRVDIHGRNRDDQVVFHAFQNGFSFPYYGSERTGITIGVNGYISFENISDNRFSDAIPSTDSNIRKIHLAPFWTNLHTRENGRVYAAAVDANTYVIQWSKVSPIPGSGMAAGQEYDVNFQVVLRSTGEFEFRYGAMRPPEHPIVDIWAPCYPDSCESEARGSVSTVGYQDPTGTVGTLLHFGGSYLGSPTNVTFPGGFDNRTFKAIIAPKGKITINPTTDSLIKVCGILDGYTECQAQLVLVAKAGDLQISELQPNQADPTKQWFEVRNLREVAYDIGRLTIRSGARSHAIQPAGGKLSIPAFGHAVLAASAAPGGFTPDYVYGNGLAFGTTDSVSLGLGAVTLASASWDSAWVFPSGGTLMVDDAFAALGAVSHPLSHWCPSSAGTPRAGEGCHYVLDRNANVPLIDIATTGTPIPRFTGLNVVGEVPDGIGFEMPYFGGTVTDLWASISGFVSFGPLSDPAGVNREIPMMAPPLNGVVAPFWDRLGNAQTGQGNTLYQRMRILGEQVTIVQWVHRRVEGGGGGSLSFQVQLWESGDIVFGYLRLDPAGISELHSGSNAMIGIEDLGGQRGYVSSFRKAKSVTPGQAILYRKK